MMHAGAQHVIDASEDVGVDAALTRTIQGFYQRALDASEKAGKPSPSTRSSAAPPLEKQHT